MLGLFAGERKPVPATANDVVFIFVHMDQRFGRRFQRVAAAASETPMEDVNNTDLQRSFLVGQFSADLFQTLYRHALGSCAQRLHTDLSTDAVGIWLTACDRKYFWKVVELRHSNDG
jgi:hypothetical protein